MILLKLIISLFKVRKQIFSGHILHNNNKMINSFEVVDHTYNIWVLADFHYFKLFFNLSNFSLAHVLLFETFYCDLLISAFMNSEVNDTKLARTEFVFNFIKIFKWPYSRSNGELLDPLLLKFFWLKVDYSCFCLR